MDMGRVLLVDHSLCTGCRLCELACSFRHEGVFLPLMSRIRVWSDEANGIFVPVVCQQCDDPPCVWACPGGALARDESRGLVTYVPGRCLGCRICMVVCPFGAIGYDSLRRHVRKCDLCDGDPACAEACPSGALFWGTIKAAAGRKRREGATLLLCRTHE